MNVWRQWTRGQWALRLLILLGPVVALLARWPSAGAPRPWLVALTLVLSAGWALVPESVVGVVALLVVAFSWADGLSHHLPGDVLVAAAALVAAHVAAVLASYGPARLPVSPPVARLWAVRAGLVFLAAPAVWLLAVAVRELPDSGTVWLLGMAVVLSVVVVAAGVTQANAPEAEG